MAESRGFDNISENDTSVLIQAALFTAANAKVTSGTGTYRLWHILPATGALETFDFSDSSFKTGAITTPTAALTHRTAENAGYDTGIWSARFTALSALTRGDKYIVEVTHSSLPRVIQYTFEYGSLLDLLEGDETIDKTTDPTQWQQVVKTKGEATELLRKKLYKSDGTTKIVGDSHIVGKRSET